MKEISENKIVADIPARPVSIVPEKKENDTSALKGDLVQKVKFEREHPWPYEVDIVFCIDNSENMTEHMDRVKAWIPEIIDRYSKIRTLQSYGIRKYRARLIVFNDYRIDPMAAVMVTDFFDLKNNYDNFLKALNQVKIKPGVTDSVCGLEALTYAAHSDWTDYKRKRQYVWVFSNSDISGIDDPEIIAHHPKGMPKSEAEFLRHWKLVEGFYCICLMAPDTKNWDTLCNLQCLHYPSEAGKGMNEFDFDSIMHAGFDV